MCNNCTCNIKLFLSGLVVGMCGGAIIVGLSKKAQNLVKKGKAFAEQKINELKEKSNQNQDN